MEVSSGFGPPGSYYNNITVKKEFDRIQWDK
jgi:hypothetical protein